MFHKRWLTVFIALTLLLLLVPACGGGGEENTPAPTLTPTATLSPTPTSVATLTAAPSPTPAGPVKIGAISAWSGPMAISGLALADPVIKLVDWQTKEMGGILGGREVKIIKYDSRASAPEAQAGARKLLLQDKVSTLVWGGLSSPEFKAVMDFAAENKILFVALTDAEGLAENRFSVNALPSKGGIAQAYVTLATKVFQAKTVAILGQDLKEVRIVVSMYKPVLEAAGVKIVYEEYTPLGTVDFMPYLTKIKYDNPDVLMLDQNANEHMITIAKQIMELGGWGGIKVLTYPSAESAARFPGTQGWYILTPWFSGLPYPGAVKFEKDYQVVNGKLPTGSHIFFYNPLWAAIYAIELAGTDTDLVKIAQAARSGKLEWDTPCGRAHFAPDGDSALRYSVGHVEGGKLVPVTLPE